jgi:hypothetical protein
MVNLKTQKIFNLLNSKIEKCTPYVSPKEDYLIFATIGNQLNLMISFNDENEWSVKWVDIESELKNN